MTGTPGSFLIADAAPIAESVGSLVEVPVRVLIGDWLVMADAGTPPAAGWPAVWPGFPAMVAGGEAPA